MATLMSCTGLLGKNMMRILDYITMMLDGTDSETGRFLSEDPAGQGPNNYSYCGNNPVIRTDPTGQLFGWDDLIYAIIMGIANGIENSQKGGNFWGGFAVGAISSLAGEAVGGAVSGALGATAIQYRVKYVKRGSYGRNHE